MTRVLIILFAYFCAAIAAAVLVLLLSSIVNGEHPLMGISDLRVVGTFTLIAAIYATPVALPVIIATEIRKIGNWPIFIGAGAFLGVLLTFLLTEVPFKPSNLLFSGIFFPSAVLAASIYWLVAWKWMPPPNREPIELGRAYL